jgi:hypothetical protein
LKLGYGKDPARTGDGAGAADGARDGRGGGLRLHDLDGGGLWAHGANGRVNPGSDGSSVSALASPLLTVTADGDVQIDLTHAYDTERPGDFFDGDIFEARFKGNAFVQLPPVGGYPRATSTDDGCDGLSFLPCWGGDNGGQVVDTLFVTGLMTGDMLQLRLLFGSDGDVQTAGDDWTVSALSLSNVAAVPLPASAALLLAGVGGLAAASRRRKA